MDKKIILFDGYCNFCNFWVDFVIKKDKNKIFKFAGIQSGRGQELLQSQNIKVTPDTVILIEKGQHFTKSTASLRILGNLAFPVKFISYFLIIPRSVRDFIYDLIARHRYKLFGKMDYCRMPSESEKDRFLT